MDKIIDTFRPWLDQTLTLDIVPTKLGWIMAQAEPIGVEATHLLTENDLLEALVIQFIERADGDDSREDARLARKAMAPYLAQLTPEQVQRVDHALELYAKLDDIAPPG